MSPDQTDDPKCGCQEIGSPVEGVLVVDPHRGPIQRCDTHPGGPLYETDWDAAQAAARHFGGGSVLYDVPSNSLFID
jgi:hypothetical protein